MDRKMDHFTVDINFALERANSMAWAKKGDRDFFVCWNGASSHAYVFSSPELDYVETVGIGDAWFHWRDLQRFDYENVTRTFDRPFRSPPPHSDHPLN